MAAHSWCSTDVPEQDIRSLGQRVGKLNDPWEFSVFWAQGLRDGEKFPVQITDNKVHRRCGFRSRFRIS